MSEWKAGTVMKDPSKWIKPEEVSMILDCAAQHNARNHLILYLLFRTGRRIGELLQLKVEDIHYKEGMITWNIEKKHKRLKGPDNKFLMITDKEGKEKFVTQKIFLKANKPLDSVAMRKLREYVLTNNLQPGSYVFASPINEGKPISRITVWIFLSKYAKKLNIKIHPHSLRHCFAIAVANKIKSPGDLMKLRDILEHSSIQVTEGYLQFNPKETRKLMEDTFVKKLPELEEYEL